MAGGVRLYFRKAHPSTLYRLYQAYNLQLRLRKNKISEIIWTIKLSFMIHICDLFSVTKQEDNNTKKKNVFLCWKIIKFPERFLFFIFFTYHKFCILISFFSSLREDRENTTQRIMNLSRAINYFICRSITVQINKCQSWLQKLLSISNNAFFYFWLMEKPPTNICFCELISFVNYNKFF